MYRLKRLPLPVAYQDDMKTFFTGLKRVKAGTSTKRDVDDTLGTIHSRFCCIAIATAVVRAFSVVRTGPQQFVENQSGGRPEEGKRQLPSPRPHKYLDAALQPSATTPVPTTSVSPPALQDAPPRSLVISTRDEDPAQATDEGLAGSSLTPYGTHRHVPTEPVAPLPSIYDGGAAATQQKKTMGGWQASQIHVASTKFDGKVENWSGWKTEMQTILHWQGLLQVLKGVDFTMPSVQRETVSGATALRPEQGRLIRRSLCHCMVTCWIASSLT
ncbi:hypothetical protein F443_14514 [Phytophthora nicotianae P1569]|uniref:Uncharacterized protein n=2 Tax=Phytophthora nicotianae TaxID=4792 RepID=V9EPG2_PHYNI|nr:hypothetical protein F443_14514 [Phytophthora nicotianae P1569]